MKCDVEIKNTISDLENEIQEAVKDTRYTYAQECEDKICALKWVLEELDFICVDYKKKS